MEVDEHPRDTTIETLAKLPPVFKKDGLVTAGSASGELKGYTIFFKLQYEGYPCNLIKKNLQFFSSSQRNILHLCVISFYAWLNSYYVLEGVCDGAAAVLLCEEETAKKLHLQPLARLLAWQVIGVDPKIMGKLGQFFLCT